MKTATCIEHIIDSTATLGQLTQSRQKQIAPITAEIGETKANIPSPRISISVYNWTTVRTNKCRVARPERIIWRGIHFPVDTLHQSMIVSSRIVSCIHTQQDRYYTPWNRWTRNTGNVEHLECYRN